MDLHTHRVETHVIEITLLTPYKSESDLKVIDTLLKTDIENVEQVSKIMAIIPAAKCLGLRTHYMPRGDHQEAWLAYVDPKYVTHPFPYYIWDIKGADGKLLKSYEDSPKVY